MVQKILTKLEIVAKNWQLKYMASKKTTEVIEEGRLLFHPNDCHVSIMLEYKKRLIKLGLKR
ncbi:MAG: hypothetical protein NT052_00185 [Candidatus Shapirobacteria bacterium]|nr:hypothetical protein [Candidatus Shapirobacteria bacterium]